MTSKCNEIENARARIKALEEALRETWECYDEGFVLEPWYCRVCSAGAPDNAEAIIHEPDCIVPSVLKDDAT